MPWSGTDCLLAEGTVEMWCKLMMISYRSWRKEKKDGTFSTVHKHLSISTAHPPPADIWISACWTLNSCVFPVSFGTQRVHVWVRATGWPDTQWQTRPWADRTNAITPHAAHSAAAQNTAISYLSRQLCLRRGIEKRQLAFYHTNTSLGTEREDKHITDLTRI